MGVRIEKRDGVVVVHEWKDRPYENGFRRGLSRGMTAGIVTGVLIGTVASVGLWLLAKVIAS